MSPVWFNLCVKASHIPFISRIIMKHLTGTWALPLLFSLFCARAASVEAQARSEDISIARSFEIVEQNSLWLKIADSRVESARAQKGALDSFWYPTAELSGTYTHFTSEIEVRESLETLSGGKLSEIGASFPANTLLQEILSAVESTDIVVPIAPRNVASLNVNVVWPLFTGGRRLNSAKMGSALVEIAQTDRRQAESDVLSELVAVYYGVRLAQAVAEVRLQTYDALEKHFRNAARLEQEGMIKRSERLVAEVNAAEARNLWKQSSNDLGVAREALQNLLRADSVTFNPTSELFVLDLLPPRESFHAAAEDNPAIKKLSLQNDIAESELRIKNGAYLPSVALFGSQALYTRGLNRNLVPRTLVGVGLSWTLFDGLAREKSIRSSALVKEQLNDAKTKIAEDIRTAADKLYAELQNSLGSVESLKTALSLSRELVRARRKAFGEGMATSTEVVDAEVLLSEAKLGILAACYRFDTSLMGLLTLCSEAESFIDYASRGVSGTSLVGQ